MNRYFQLQLSESQLTLNVMDRVIEHCNIPKHDDEAIDFLYYETISLTGDWPEDEGFGSSDAYGIIQAMEEWIRAERIPVF